MMGMVVLQMLDMKLGDLWLDENRLEVLQEAIRRS
jgi:hypothetical protein